MHLHFNLNCIHTNTLTCIKVASWILRALVWNIFNFPTLWEKWKYGKQIHQIDSDYIFFKVLTFFLFPQGNLNIKGLASVAFSPLVKFFKMHVVLIRNYK